MMDNPIYKIKDSVDLFLSNDKYIIAYYMNTRQKKSFRVNESMVKLLQVIDGEHDLKELYAYMEDSCGVDKDEVDEVIGILKANRIITEIVHDQKYLSLEDQIRYDRQINYFSEYLWGEEDALRAQRQLMDSKVAILGCGAVGGDIALELAMAGVQRFVLYDMDVVDLSDISRHMFFCANEIGKPKVEALKKALREIDARIHVECIQDTFEPESNIEDIIERMDFIVNTLDEPYIGYTSAKISRMCVKKQKPHYIAGGFDAHLASTGELVIPFITPCVECYANHFKKTLANWKPKKHPIKYRYTRIGGLASMSLFSASYASIEIIKFLTGIVDMNDQYKVRGEFTFKDLELAYLNVEKDSQCPVCGRR